MAADFCTIIESTCAHHSIAAGFASADEPLNESLLTDDERAILSPQATPVRRRSFRLGRVAAHRALERLSVADGGAALHGSVLAGERHEPIFPRGCVGSLSHSGSYALAVAARAAAVRGIGVDLQHVRPVKLEIADRICLPEELRWCEAAAEGPALRLISLFAAKEAIYKAIAPIVGRFFGFSAARLSWDESRQCFDAELTETLGSGIAAGQHLEVYLRQQVVVPTDAFLIAWTTIGYPSTG